MVATILRAGLSSQPFDLGLRLITPPTAPPIALDDIKEDLRVEHSDDDELITAYLDAATQWVEQRLERRLMTQTLELVLDQFPTREIFLPVSPVQSITSINYADGTAQTLVPAADYYLDNARRDPWIFPNAAWPSAQAIANAVAIRFVAGYDAAAKIPQPINQAIRLLVREAYDGDDVEKTVDRLLLNYLRVYA